MRQVRFVQKDGRTVDVEIVRQRFFGAAIAGNVHPDRASRIWNNAIFGRPLSRRLVEEKCEIEIVAADAGFGFLE
jgi:hypothetical protein